MMTDLYQLTMMYGYYKCGMRDKRAAFDMFYRSKDESTHCAVMAGVEQLIDYISNLHFDDADIDYLRSQKLFDEDFLAELRAFSFHGDVWAPWCSPTSRWCAWSRPSSRRSSSRRRC